MVPMSHMIVSISHMMVSTITLLGTLNFNLLFKFNIYKKQIVLVSHWIVLASHVMVLISHLIVPIK